MGFSEAQLPRGVALLFVAHAVPWLGGQRPRENFIGIQSAVLDVFVDQCFLLFLMNCEEMKW